MRRQQVVKISVSVVKIPTDHWIAGRSVACTEVMTAQRTQPMPTGIACGVGFVGAIVATIVAVACRATHDPALALIPLGAVTAAVAAMTSRVGGLAAAWMCWMLDSGFVLGRTAQLTFDRPSGIAALVLVAVAAASGTAAHVHRRRRQLIQSAKERPETFS